MLAGISFLPNKIPQQFDFRFSSGALREDEIFESALSVPGRYLLEIGQRLLEHSPTSEWLLIANPLLPLQAHQISLWCDSQPSSVFIAASHDGFPVFYCIPPNLITEYGRFLLLLSGQDAFLDGKMLEALSGQSCKIKNLPIANLGNIPPHGSNGWLNGDKRLKALQLQGKTALDLINKDKNWRKRPFAIYYPMHAGDVLFMSVASGIVPNLLYEKQVVCSAYRDIPSSSDSKLDMLELKLPWIPRDGSVSERDYFANALKRLPHEITNSHFFVFSRILRLYYRTPFHLVDHAAFALGKSYRHFDHCLHATPIAKEQRCTLPINPLRVLFHLDGGWHLKIYPLNSIKTIITALKAAMISVSVIDRPDLEKYGAESLKSETTADLRQHIENHHIFVGVDSFPHHFSCLVMGWPTIGLFGNTKPTNSDYCYGQNYGSTDKNMSCNRCGAYDTCPFFGRDDCPNYADPDEIIENIFAMSARHYGFTM